MAILTFLTDGHLPTPLRIGGIALAALAAIPLGHTLLLSLESRRWPTTEGTIVSSTIVESADSDSAEIRYSYVVGGRQYFGCRVHFGLALGYNLSSGPDDLVAARRPGSRARVFYDPARPTRSVLEPGPRVLTLLLFSSAVALAAFLAWPWLAG